MIVAILFGLSVVGIIVALFFDWRAKQPDYVTPEGVGVKYVDGAPILPGLNKYISAMDVVHRARDYDIPRYDVWVFPVDAPALSPRLIGERYTGTVHRVSGWGGLVQRRTVRIRHPGTRGDVRRSALGHELAWHVVPYETTGSWNREHATNMESLEHAYDVRYLWSAAAS